MKQLLTALLIAAAALTQAGVVYTFESEQTTPRPARVAIYRGEDVTLSHKMTNNLQPVQMSDEATATLYYQSGKMGDEWWEAPASVSGDTVSAVFSANLDNGATSYSYFIRVNDHGSSYRAFGTISMKPSPGFTPAVLDDPQILPTIRKEILDEATKMDATVTAELKAWVEGNAYLTSFTETDPTIHPWAKNINKPSYSWSEILSRPTEWAWAAISGKPSWIGDGGASTITIGRNGPGQQIPYTIEEAWLLGGESLPVDTPTYFELKAKDGGVSIIPTEAWTKLLITSGIEQNTWLQGALAGKAAASWVNDNFPNYAYVHDHYFNKKDLNDNYPSYAWLNQQGFIKSETDPTIKAWAKAATKPSYSIGEIKGGATASFVANLNSGDGVIQLAPQDQVVQMGNGADGALIQISRYANPDDKQMQAGAILMGDRTQLLLAQGASALMMRDGLGDLSTYRDQAGVSSLATIAALKAYSQPKGSYATTTTTNAITSRVTALETRTTHTVDGKKCVVAYDETLQTLVLKEIQQ